MKWESALSQEAITDLALTEIIEVLRAKLPAEDVSLVYVSASLDHDDQWPTIPVRLQAAFPHATVIGSSGGGIIGKVGANTRELEGECAVAVTIACLPDVAVGAALVREPYETPEAWNAALGLELADDAALIVIPDPYSFELDACLDRLDRCFPRARVVGGIASGGLSRGSQALFCGDEMAREGAVVAALVGDIELEPVIAQGCKPIGEPMMISSCEGNVIYSLDEKSPADVLRDLFESLDEDDRLLFRTSLFVGLEMRDQRQYEAGDFLIRNIIGLTDDGRELAISALAKRWQVFQFHLRDKQTSADDLRVQLERYRDRHPDEAPAGALLFSCLGRGRGLYGEAHHDTRICREVLGEVPVGGFFCNGEIGPVGDQTFTHGYTSVFGFFRNKKRHLA
ncbi:MAG: FIST N-terminal domain-containing protein [Myxococcota bacterium]